MSGCKIFEYTGGGVYEIIWDDGFCCYLVNDSISSDEVKEGVLYRGPSIDIDVFVTHHNGKLIGLEIPPALFSRLVAITSTTSRLNRTGIDAVRCF